jgi:hypothetical protein
MSDDERHSMSYLPVAVATLCVAAAAAVYHLRSRLSSPTPSPTSSAPPVSKLQRFLQACKDADLQSAQSLLDTSADLRQKTCDGCNALHLAAIEANMALVTWLLDTVRQRDPGLYSALLNDPADNGWTPLHVASAQGHAELVSDLLDRGADPCSYGMLLSTTRAAAHARRHRNRHQSCAFMQPTALADELCFGAL